MLDDKFEIQHDLTESDLLALYSQLCLTREFEMRVAKLYSQKGLPENPHLCVGEEAIGIGSCYGLREDDFVLPSLRGRSVFLAKGVSPSTLMAGIYGKHTGPSKGKYPSHHMGDLKKGVLAGSLIIGSQFPLAAGAGFAFKLKKTNQVCLCYFGDGASNRGDFHEGINISAILNLPVIFICNNNGYAIDMQVEKAMSIKDIALRGQSYGIPGITIDGNNVLEVYQTVKKAVKRAREGEGPSLIECKTYRLRPHCERYPESRPKDEIDFWWGRCPVKNFKIYLSNKKILTESLDQKICEKVKDEIDLAVKFAEDSQFPEPSEIYEDVYENGTIKDGRLCMK